jgi:hypothetical protein
MPELSQLWVEVGYLLFEVVVLSIARGACRSVFMVVVLIKSNPHAPHIWICNANWLASLI